MAEVTHGDRGMSLALLYVVRWAKYRRSPHFMGQAAKDQEMRRIAENRRLSLDGRNPVGHDAPEPDYCHVLRQAIGSMEDLDPSPQEAWLTVELAGRSIGFGHWRFLAAHSRSPWSWWESGGGGTTACQDCAALIALLASELGRRLGRSAHD